jgi:hypothetical protein
MGQPTIQPPRPVAMVQPRNQPFSPRSSTSSTLYTLKYRASTFSDRVLRRRYVLSLLATIILLIMAISIVFVAHSYYHQFGGQGFLKARGEEYFGDSDPPRLYLPLRKVQATLNARRDDNDSLLTYLPWNIRALGPGSNVPFYTCGDQTNSCETFDQPARMTRCEKFIANTLAEYLLPNWINLL